MYPAHHVRAARPLYRQDMQVCLGADLTPRWGQKVPRRCRAAPAHGPPSALCDPWLFITPSTHPTHTHTHTQRPALCCRLTTSDNMGEPRVEQLHQMGLGTEAGWGRRLHEISVCTGPYRDTGGGGGIPCGGKYESTTSGATKSVPLLKNERTSYVWFPISAHKKQWALAVIGLRPTVSWGVSWRPEPSPPHLHSALFGTQPDSIVCRTCNELRWG